MKQERILCKKRELMEKTKFDVKKFKEDFFGKAAKAGIVKQEPMQPKPVQTPSQIKAVLHYLIDELLGSKRWRLMQYGHGMNRKYFFIDEKRHHRLNIIIHHPQDYCFVRDSGDIGVDATTGENIHEYVVSHCVIPIESIEFEYAGNSFYYSYYPWKKMSSQELMRYMEHGVDDMIIENDLF